MAVWQVRLRTAIYFNLYDRLICALAAMRLVATINVPIGLVSSVEFAMRPLGSPLALILPPYVRNDTSSGGRRVSMTAERAPRAWWLGVWAARGVLI